MEVEKITITKSNGKFNIIVKKGVKNENSIHNNVVNEIAELLRSDNKKNRQMFEKSMKAKCDFRDIGNPNT